MLDHGQVGPATPESSSPSTSRRPSSNHKQRPELTMTALTPSKGSGSGSRRGSMLSGGAGVLSSSTLESAEEAVADSDEEKNSPTSAKAKMTISRRESTIAENAMLLGRRLSNTMDEPPSILSTGVGQAPATMQVRSDGKIIQTSIPELSGQTSTLPSSSTRVDETQVTIQTAQSSYISPADLAAQVAGNPKLAALRQSMTNTLIQANEKPSVVSPPLLINPKCSGYFLEPVCKSIILKHSLR
jgi:dual specificity phosphatase 12